MCMIVFVTFQRWKLIFEVISNKRTSLARMRPRPSASGDTSSSPSSSSSSSEPLSVAVTLASKQTGWLYRWWLSRDFSAVPRAVICSVCVVIPFVLSDNFLIPLHIHAHTLLPGCRCVLTCVCVCVLSIVKRVWLCRAFFFLCAPLLFVPFGSKITRVISVPFCFCLPERLPRSRAGWVVVCGFSTPFRVKCRSTYFDVCIVIEGKGSADNRIARRRKNQSNATRPSSMCVCSVAHASVRCKCVNIWSSFSNAKQGDES